VVICYCKKKIDIKSAIQEAVKYAEINEDKACNEALCYCKHDIVDAFYAGAKWMETFKKQ
jgi:hypothetical protein